MPLNWKEKSFWMNSHFHIIGVDTSGEYLHVWGALVIVDMSSLSSFSVDILARHFAPSGYNIPLTARSNVLNLYHTYPQGICNAVFSVKSPVSPSFYIQHSKTKLIVCASLKWTMSISYMSNLHKACGKLIRFNESYTWTDGLRLNTTIIQFLI